MVAANKRKKFRVSDLVSELRVGSREAAAGALRVVPLVLPDAVDELTMTGCLLDRDRLRQVAWLVDVGALEVGHEYDNSWSGRQVTKGDSARLDLRT